MSSADEIKYQGVPDGVSRAAADASWEFMEELDLATKELEDVGRTVAGARLSANPAEWARRIREGKTLLTAAKARLKLVLSAINKMDHHAPK